MFLLAKRKEIMPPHRGGDLRQIKLLKSNYGDMMSTKKEEKVATHLTEEVILVKSNCGDMMSTKREKKLQRTSQRR